MNGISPINFCGGRVPKVPKGAQLIDKMNDMARDFTNSARSPQEARERMIHRAAAVSPDVLENALENAGIAGNKSFLEGMLDAYKTLQKK